MSLFRWVLWIASAAMAAYALHLGFQRPDAVIVPVAIGLTWLGMKLWRREQQKRLLRSGDVDAVLSQWQTALARLPDPETMVPLMRAAAFAAFGWVERAKRSLASAKRGSTWEASLEYRLLIDTLLLIFEGYRDEAVAITRRLVALPLPNGSPLSQDRVSQFRAAINALARAFARQSTSTDIALLTTVSDSSPLVYWPMRYGAAVAALDCSRPADAEALIAGAPDWPEESALKTVHQEITGQIALQKR